MDYDDIARDNRENPVAANKKLTKLKQCLVEAAKEPWLHILFNSPCLEYWLLLHYEPHNRRAYDGYEGDLKTALRTHLPDYEKSRKYYEAGIDLYSKLRPRLATAMQSAATIQFDPTAGTCAPAAELHRLLTALRVG